MAIGILMLAGQLALRDNPNLLRGLRILGPMEDGDALLMVEAADGSPVFMTAGLPPNTSFETMERDHEWFRAMVDRDPLILRETEGAA